jgi:hypothetical protein
VSTALWVVSLALGTAFYSAPPDEEDVPDLISRYQSTCGGSSTPTCKQLQWQLEGILYADLRAYQNYTGKGVDPEVVMAALGADSPQLKLWGIRAAGTRPSSEATALIVEALDDPYPRVREEALNTLRNLDPKYVKYQDRLLRSGGPSDYPRPDPVPTAATIGGQVYPGAKFRAFASNDKFALYTTSDPVEKVLAFYATGGRKAQSSAEVKAEAQKKTQAMSDPQAMMALMKQAQAQGKDIATMMMERQKSVGGGMELLTYEGKAGVVGPKYVPLNDGGSRRVLVFKDDSLGATSVVFEVSDPERAAATTQMMSGKTGGLDPMQRMELQKFVQKPLADGSPSDPKKTR